MLMKFTDILVSPVSKEVPANLGGAKASCIEQGGFRRSTAPSRCLVGIGALAQEQERRGPLLEQAGEEQWRRLGKRGGAADSPL